MIVVLLASARPAGEISIPVNEPKVKMRPYSKPFDDLFHRDRGVPVVHLSLLVHSVELIASSALRASIAQITA